MLDWASQLLGYIQTAFQYFLNLISSLLMAIGFLGTAGNFTTGLIPFMPPIVGTAMVIFIAIYVIKFLIGR